MNRKNLEILGLSEGATPEEIKNAYEKLREKYLEDRFLDGEEGNEAAKNLSRIETAYQELLNEISENATAEDGGESFAKVEEKLRAGDIQEAQRLLDAFNERNGQWHYLQSVIFYRKNWINESKKQLEIAIQLEPDNEKYKESYRKLNERLNYDANNAPKRDESAYRGQTMERQPSDQMGDNVCMNCIDCCSTYLCMYCLCDSCCR